ncbi:MAG: flippase [Ignavibacteria bacterium]|nr:flippase [Ignavibacteria bacterium]
MSEDLILNNKYDLKTEAKGIKKNSFFSFVSITSRLVANVLAFWIIARFYGPETFGQFTFAHTLSIIFVLFADFGLDILLTTELAKNKNKAIYIFQQLFSLKLVFCLIALIIFWVIAIFYTPSFQAKLLILIFSFYTVFTAIINFLCALFKGFEKLRYETNVSLFINLSLLILIILPIIFKVSIIFIAFSFVITRVLGFFVGVYYSFRLLPNITFNFKIGNIKEIKDKVVVFGVHLLLSNLFFQIDTILLAFWKDEYNVGIYQAAFKVVLLTLVIPDIFNNSLIPTLTRIYSENNYLWKRFGELMNKSLFIIALPISIILFVFAEQIIHLIYGAKGFTDSISILRIFAVILLIRFSLETYAMMLTTSNRQKVRMKIVILGILINLIADYFLIPIYGAYGAGISALITTVYLAIAYYSTNFEMLKKWLLDFKTISLLITTLVILELLLTSNKISVFIFAPIIFILFYTLSYLFLYSKEEKKLIFSEELKSNLLNIGKFLNR